MARRLAAVCAVLAATPLALPAAAPAHAQLEGVTPQRGAVAQAAPGAVAFRFDEAVEGNFGAVRVFDARGERVDAGDAYHPGGHGEQIAVHLKPSLGDGTYTATYRVVSADGHVVSGGSTFSVGRPGARARRSPTCSRARTPGP
ncbi:copper resistance CopC family protein [Capillimicrobium parvum]|uniref:copper resistance CopC family protein n=1 Tax=Capillimicrobium parvum TaxID=2884022 RepID=UPI00216AF84E|nr:copper resistance CopC family protein [Capillimicrobium parvum]